MTKREIASLICKVLAIQTFITVIQWAPSVYTYVMSTLLKNSAVATRGTPNLTEVAEVAQALPILFSIFAGLYLWFRADEMAGLLVKESPSDTEPRSETLVTGPETQTLVFTGLGLYTLLYAIPETVKWITLHIYLTAQPAAPEAEMYMGRTAETVRAFVEVALGFWLLLGASGLVRLLATLRASQSYKGPRVES